MKLTNLELVNFKSYDNLNINFSDNLNIFYGNNGQGKTNLLESIYVLALTKTYRSLLDVELIKFGENEASIKGKIKKGDKIEKLEVIFSKNGKIIKKNYKKIKKYSDYISNLPIILFTPDDLSIIKGAPAIRRKYLNIEIGQLDNKYISLLNKYNVVLKNRNEYLRTINKNLVEDSFYLDILTEKLVDLMVKIHEYRNEFINNLNKNIGVISKKIIEKEVYIEYEFHKVFLEKNKKEALINEFKKIKKKEIFLGSTLLGTHKDDIIFKLDGEDIRKFSSQGQQRGTILALKLAEIDIFKAKKGYNPILLFDDVLSEFDINKKNNFLNFIDKDIQTIITTTSLNSINEYNLEKASKYYIDNAKIIKIDEVEGHEQGERK